jgi:zinc protease
MNRTETRRRSGVLPLPRAGAPPLPHVPEPSRFTLDNGLRLIAVPWGELPQVVLKLVLPAGAIVDPPERPGTAGLIGRLLTEGTTTLTAEALNARLDLLGASVDIQVSHDFAEIELFVLSEMLPEALALLAELVVRPSFPPHEVERARREVLDALVGRLDEPANLADDHAAAAVFGTDHPYGRPALGTREGIESITREHLHAFHAATYRPSGGFIVVSGAIEAEPLAEMLAASLAGWNGSPASVRAPQVPPRCEAAGQQIELPWEGAQQAEIRAAGLGLPRTSPIWIPAAVANFILGGSTITGRLGANLREDKGWTYGVRSAFSAGLQPGGWMADAAVDAAVREDAVREMTYEIRRMVEEPVSEEELRRAQDALVLSLPRAFETPGRVVSRFVTLEAFGLAADYWDRFPAAVRAVTVDEVQRVSADCFAPEQLVQVVVG